MTAAATTPRGVPARPAGEGRWARRIRFYAPTILVFVATIVLWEVAVRSGATGGFPLPAPTQILEALGANWAAGRWPLGKAAAATLFEAVGGLMIGTVAGVAVAFAAARYSTARELLLPLAVGASAVPIIAFAPLMNNWFGALSPLSKMMMAAVLVYFPVMVNVTRGLIAAEPAALELMRSYAASEWTVLRKVRVPTALPFFFTALKVATTLSLIGAIVGEYFGGSSLVLGRIIVQASSALRFDVTWAAVLLAAVTGIVFYLAVVILERVFIPWHASLRTDEP
ncbi:MAG: ABC transporter permease [Candidatus Limnocylindrales bacterium]